MHKWDSPGALQPAHVKLTRQPQQPVSPKAENGSNWPRAAWTSAALQLHMACHLRSAMRGFHPAHPKSSTVAASHGAQVAFQPLLLSTSTPKTMPTTIHEAPKSSSMPLLNPQQPARSPFLQQAKIHRIRALAVSIWAPQARHCTSAAGLDLGEAQPVLNYRYLRGAASDSCSGC